MFLIARLECAVFGLCKRAASLTSGFFEKGGPVRQCRADLAAQMCAGIGVVYLVRVGEVCAESVFEINRRPVMKAERGILEYGLPVANAMLWGC